MNKTSTKKSENTSSKSKESKKNSTSKEFCDSKNKLQSFGSVNPSVFEEYVENLSGILENTSQTNSSKTVRKTKKSEDNSSKNVLPQRNLRSNDKCKKFLQNIQVKDFFTNLEWYNENQKHYEEILSIVFDDFSTLETSESHYNYILLDSRKCTDLKTTTWKNFINAIFYVGMGQNGRCCDHMVDAKKVWPDGCNSGNKKINRISNIWKDKSPVIILTIAEFITKFEANTREAFLIDALGKERLCNIRSGTYYGKASTMTTSEKRAIGAVLLAGIVANDFIKNRATYVYLKNSELVQRKNKLAEV